MSKSRVRFTGTSTALQREDLRKHRHESERRERLAVGPGESVRDAMRRQGYEDGTTYRDTGAYVITWADGKEIDLEVDDFIRTFRDGIISKAVEDDVLYTAGRISELMNLWQEIKEDTRIARGFVREDTGTPVLGPSVRLRDSSDRRIFDAITEAWHHQMNVRREEHDTRRHVIMDRNADEYAERLARIKRADAFSELRDYILGIKDPVRRAALMAENSDIFGDFSDRIDADIADEAGDDGYIVRPHSYVTGADTDEE